MNYGKKELAIANSGEEFKETSSGWIGTKIRKGKQLGKIIDDHNGMFRRLTVLFKNGKKEDIVLNNIGTDSPEVHKYEYQTKMQGKLTWYRF